MNRLLLIALAVAAVVGAVSFWTGKVYLIGREAERASSATRAEGMKVEREVLNDKVRNVTTEQRCLRNGLDFVPDETGGHCN